MSFTKANQTGSTGSDKGGRIYQSQPQENKYQGAAKSIGFNPVQAANSSKAMEQYSRRVVEDGNTKMRNLQREQELTTKSLLAQQTADAGQLRVDNAREANALKVEQTYNTNALKQQHTFQEGQLRLEAQHLQAKGQVASARTQLIGSSINSLLSFGGSVLKYADTMNKLAEQDERIDGAINSVFDIEDGGGVEANAAASQVDFANANDVIRAEDAIQQATDDPNVGNALRGDVSVSTVNNQQRRDNAYGAQADYAQFHSQWVNDMGVTYTRPDGSTFNVGTMRDSADVGIVDAAARNAFYRAAGVEEMPRAQIAEALVPTVRQVSSNWRTSANNAINAGAVADRVKSANVDIISSLEAGVNLETVFSQGFSGLYSSGAYIGQKGKAGEDTVKAMLSWAVENNRPDVIEALRGVHKRHNDDGTPVKGTQLGRQFSELFDAAEDQVIDTFVDDTKREINFANAQIQIADRNRISALAAAETPQQEIEINERFADQIDALSTPEARQRAAQLRAAPNYSPFTATDMQEQQAAGATFTNDELEGLVANGDLKPSEAVALGYDRDGGGSRDTVRSERVESFSAEAKGQGRAAVTAAVRSQVSLTSDEMQFLQQGAGSSVINDIQDRLLEELEFELRENPDWKDSDIRTWLTTRGQALASEVTYDEETEQLTYEFGPKADSTSFTVQSPTTNRTVISYVGEKPEALAVYPNVSVTENPILGRRELTIAGGAFVQGQPLPQSLEDKAAALGTNAETLLRGQYAFYGQQMPQPIVVPERVAPPTPARIDRQGGSALSAEAFKTNQVIGGVSLDRLRDSIISKESANNFSAVNPHSGALGYGQVMPANVKSWTTQALGYAVSQREFLRSPDIQMAVINDRFLKMLQQQASAGYTGETLMRRVASIWYSGQAGLYNNTRPQSYGSGTYPSIASYTLDVVGRYRNN